MKCPKGYTEEDVVAALQKAVDSLAASFRFGYHDTEDMKQEGMVFGLEALGRFDPEHDSGSSLATFLRTHMRYQFINLKRNKYTRHSPPCTSCIFKALKNKHESGCAEFTDKSECPKWCGWEKRNESKKNLMETCSVESARSQSETACQSDVLHQMEHKELIKLIDEQLPVGLRADYRRMVDGVSVPKRRRVKVEQAIREIVRGYNDDSD